MEAGEVRLTRRAGPGQSRADQRVAKTRWDLVCCAGDRRPATVRPERAAIQPPKPKAPVSPRISQAPAGGFWHGTRSRSGHVVTPTQAGWRLPFARWGLCLSIASNFVFVGISSSASLSSDPFLSWTKQSPCGTATLATRRCAAAHFAPLHRINHAVTQVLRIRLCHFLLASAQPTG
jgi:hypothetical protein